MAAPQQQMPIGRELKEVLADLAENLARSLSGRAYSPRIKLLDIDQVAEATGLAERTIYKRVKAGKFPAPLRELGVNKWRESTLIAWMDARDPDHEKEWG